MRAKASLQEIANTNQTLTALATEATEIARLLQESGGELSPELEQRLEVNTQALLAKVDGYNFIIEQFDAHASLWKRRKDACAAQQKRFESQIERLRERIKLAMKEMGKTEITGTYYRFQLRKSKPKLVIEDEEKIPMQFKMVVQTTVIDKEKLSAAMAEGFEIPGARLEENGSLYALENADKE